MMITPRCLAVPNSNVQTSEPAPAGQQKRSASQTSRVEERRFTGVGQPGGPTKQGMWRRNGVMRKPERSPPRTYVRTYIRERDIRSSTGIILGPFCVVRPQVITELIPPSYMDIIQASLNAPSDALRSRVPLAFAKERNNSTSKHSRLAVKVRPWEPLTDGNTLHGW